MPHTNRKPQPPPKAFVPAKFVNVGLSDEQKAAIKKSDWSIESLDNALHDLLGKGYKVTIRYDERNDCFAAWIIAPEGSDNEGWILAGRGSTPHKAVKQAAYLHFAVLEQVWGADQGRSNSLIDD